MNVKRGSTELPLKWIKRNVYPSVMSASRKALGLPATTAELINMEVDPDAFITVESFRRAYWRAEMWSKYPHPDLGVDTEAAAKAAFWEAEDRCAQANTRLVDVYNQATVPEHVRRILLGARRRIERVMAGFSVNEIAEHARWGPGASTTLPRKLATPQNKWVLSDQITAGAVPYLHSFVKWSGWNPHRDPRVVAGNRVTFVEKNAKTKRSIAIEPDWNSFFQLGLGGAIRTRLQRWGVLLPIAQEVHKLLAQRGSDDGFLATVDLKGASDGISLALVEALLPSNVLDHVLALRSPCGELDGKTFSYEKVSSMGNGFTFELETLLFWAIASEVAGHASVYGDDIIVPSASVTRLQEVFEFSGLVFNMKKSFWGSCSFRESCGGHFFDGVDVTPVYFRKALEGETRLSAANLLREKMEDQIVPYLQPVWDALADGVPAVFCGPKSVEGVLHTSWDRARPVWCRSKQTWSGKRLITKFKVESAPSAGGLRASLFGSRLVKTAGLWRLLLKPQPRMYSWHKEPGVAVTMVSEWYSDEPWGVSLMAAVWQQAIHRRKPLQPLKPKSYPSSEWPREAHYGPDNKSPGCSLTDPVRETE